LPGLDGLRAIAIIGVLLYHAGVAWLPGGFLGVDVFFVISGFLITSILISDRELAGRISFKEFYKRRARRLLPALIAMLAVTAAFMAVFFPADLEQARGDIAAALGYFSNWWYVLHHRSYFVASGRPAPLQHLWSLAVEEQFYLLWPLVLGVLLTLRARLRWVVAVAMAGAVGSAVWMGVLAMRGNVPFDTDSSRVYFGSDTHASALLIGAAAAAITAGLSQRRAFAGRDVVGVARSVRVMLDVVGLAALAAICWSMHLLSEFNPQMYRGGFVVVAALAVVVVVIASSGGGTLGALLDVAPLRWIGTRSYGLYLWHWPIFVYTRPGLDLPLHGWQALGVRLAMTVVVTEASYRLVEWPARRHFLRERPQRRHFLREWPQVRPVRSFVPGWRVVAPVASSALAVVAVVATTSFVASHRGGGSPARAAAAAHPPAAAPASAVAASSAVASPVVAGTQPRMPGDSTADALSDRGYRPSRAPHAPVTIAKVSPSRPSTARAPGTPSTVKQPIRPPSPPAPPGSSSPTPPPIPAGPPPAVSAVGDSIMIDASVSLQRACPGTEVYAVVGWQAKAVFGEIQALRAAGHLGNSVVIETGTNGIVSPKELEAVLASLADRQKVVVVNNHMARPWEPPNNAMFPAVVRAHPNAVLVDWDTVANAHPDWLSADAVHLKPVARAPYAALIKAAAGC
jgi:peptidoglycan/LPS O-acetylase OafA/YrhL